jgi:hypothetical protein
MWDVEGIDEQRVTRSVDTFAAISLLAGDVQAATNDANGSMIPSPLYY